MNFSVILFDDFETLDVFGPVEIIGRLDRYYKIGFYSEFGGIITSSQNVRVETLSINELEDPGILFIPGGFGTRTEVNNQAFLKYIADLSPQAHYVLTVCTGSALLAKTGLLNGLKATTNKMSFDWVVEQGRNVQWVRRARWVKDYKYYTSSGVSAGMDMMLGFICDLMGVEVADKIATSIEYVWNRDKDNDPFC